MSAGEAADCFSAFTFRQMRHAGDMFTSRPIRSFRRYSAISLSLVFSFSAMHAKPEPTFEPTKMAEIQEAILEAIGKKEIPGATFWLERQGQSFALTLGDKSIEPTREPLTADTIFDAASLTKVTATTPSIMLLVERGKIVLDAPVATYIPEFAAEGKGGVTIRHLMTHTSGLRAGLSLSPSWSGIEHAIELASKEKLNAKPGEEFVYSDINFILLGEIVGRVSGKRLDQFAWEEIFLPLGMYDSYFLPPENLLPRIAPTQKTANGILHGVVHDPTAQAIGGVAGHAGLFTTTRDLARYARMILNKGELDGVRVLAPETVAEMTRVQTAESVGTKRGLGWDIDSRFSRPRGELFPLGSFGHTGWTGGCLWIDPDSETFWIFLSSRVHPDGKGNIIPVQTKLATLAAEAIHGFDFSKAPNARKAKEKNP